LRFCRILVKNQSQQYEWAENWAIGSKLRPIRQGDPISLTTFISYLERVMNSIRIAVLGHKINNLKFVDDTDLLEVERNRLQENLKQINHAREAARLKINIPNTKTKVFDKRQSKRN